jgi:hypothetical protein
VEETRHEVEVTILCRHQVQTDKPSLKINYIS